MRVDKQGNFEKKIRVSVFFPLHLVVIISSRLLKNKNRQNKIPNIYSFLKANQVSKCILEKVIQLGRSMILDIQRGNLVRIIINLKVNSFKEIGMNKDYADNQNGSFNFYMHSFDHICLIKTEPKEPEMFSKRLNVRL